MDRYMKVALTGNRYAGKDSVGKLFTQIGTPVFDADSVLKFIINYNPSVAKSVKNRFGSEYMLGDYLNPLSFDTDHKMKELIDLVSFELFEAYDRFHKKHQKHSQYTVFNSSVIYEMDWSDKFDFVINVSSPKDERMYRYQMKNTDPNEWIFKNEISEIGKNRLADYIIHNQEGGPDVKGQVLKHDADLNEIYYMRRDAVRSTNSVNQDWMTRASRREVEAITS